MIRQAGITDIIAVLIEATTCIVPKKFDYKYPQTTNGLWKINREKNKVHCKTQAKREK